MMIIIIGIVGGGGGGAKLRLLRGCGLNKPFPWFELLIFTAYIFKSQITLVLKMKASVDFGKTFLYVYVFSF